MTYALVQQPIPGLWKKEYWPYIAITQCLHLCLQRHADAIETGDFQTAQRILESADQLLQAASYFNQLISASVEAMTTIETSTQAHPMPRPLYNTAAQRSPITELIWTPELKEAHSLHQSQQPHKSNVVASPYPLFIRYAGKALGLTMFAILGLFLAGCITLTTHQFASFAIVMQLASRILRRLALISGVMFTVGAICSSLKSK